jgi:protocatechuate 3,4-dioxygenase beta subunit
VDGIHPDRADTSGVASDGFTYETYSPLSQNGYLSLTAQFASQASSYTSYDYSTTNTISTAPNQPNAGLYQPQVGPNAYTSIVNAPDGNPAYEIQPGSEYMYFQADRHFVPPTPGPVTIMVDYFDSADGSKFRIDTYCTSTPSEYHSPSVYMHGSLKWKTATFMFAGVDFNALMDHYQDFRVYQMAGNPLIGRVRVISSRGSVTGTVNDASGNPIAAAQVQVTDSTGYVWGTVNTVTTGRYTVPGVPPGTYTVTAAAPGYLSASDANISVATGAASPAQFALTLNAGTLTGTVTDNLNNPLTGAGIMVQDGSGNTVAVSTTNAQGVFNIPVLTVGSYTIVVSDTGYNPSSLPATIAFQSTLSITAALTPITGALDGTVTDPNGNPIEDALVDVTDPSGNLVNFALTDDNGGYSFTSLTPLKYSLMISAPGYIPTTLSAAVVGNSVADESATLQILTGSVTGAVADMNGNPLGGVMVSFQENGQAPITATTDQNGNYSIAALDPGTYTAYFSLGGFNALVSGGVTVIGGQATTLSEDLSVSAGEVSGNVTDGNGNALSGVSVTITSGLQFSTSVTTDANGNYVCANLVPGSYTAIYQLAAYNQASQTVTITSGGTLVENETLSLIVGTANGTVTDALGHPLSGVSVAYLTSSQSVAGTATTDANGNYSIPNLVPGTYTATFQDAGYTSATAAGVSIAGNASASTNATLTLIVGTASGAVTDKNGNVLSGVTVSVVNSLQVIVASATTDGNGDFALAGIVPGSYSFEFQAPGYTSATVTSVISGNANTVANEALALIGNYALPSLSAAAPAQILHGGNGFTLTVTGTGFTPATNVKWGGKGVPTVYVSPTQVSAQIPASFYTIKKTVAVNCTNPKPGGGTSNSVNVTVD